MDTFTAIPDFQRLSIKVLDIEKLEEFYASESLDAEIPTITKIFIGYSKGPGTPVPVQIEVDRIESEYEDNLPTPEDRAALTPNQYYDKWNRVAMLLRRNLLMAVIRGMDMESANLLAASDDGDGRKILERLGWLQVRPVTNTESASESTDPNSEEAGEST